jgi:hypothetical protein
VTILGSMPHWPTDILAFLGSPLPASPCPGSPKVSYIIQNPPITPTNLSLCIPL